jgi:hypothetical protein
MSDDPPVFLSQRYPEFLCLDWFEFRSRIAAEPKVGLEYLKRRFPE